MHPLKTTQQFIRLIRFENNWSDELLKCRIEQHRFTTSLVYNTLSYEWGNSGDERTIFVNDLQFKVRRRLSWARTVMVYRHKFG